MLQISSTLIDTRRSERGCKGAVRSQCGFRLPDACNYAGCLLSPLATELMLDSRRAATYIPKRIRNTERIMPLPNHATEQRDETTTEIELPLSPNEATR